MRLLVVDPHGDDGILGCGGLINKLSTQGASVDYLILSDSAKSLPVGFTKQDLIKESKRAVEILSGDFFIRRYTFPVREFPSHRQEILELLVDLSRLCKYDMVLTPMSTDIHQDHRVTYEECVRAFKTTTIYGYEIPWNNLTITTSAFVKLGGENIDAKIDAILQYKSQKHRDYMDSSFISSLAMIRGKQIGIDYAETFEVIRQVL